MKVQIQKLQDKVTIEKRLWTLVKSFLYLLSLGTMIFWGYIKDDSESSSIENYEKLEKQRISEKDQNGDTIFYAFSKIVDGYNKR